MAKNENLQKKFGAKLAYVRKSKKLSQMKLAEIVDMNFNYIGQIERGEKNATIESIEKIAAALDISLSRLFEKLDTKEDSIRNIPLECYEFLSARTNSEQEHIFRILLEIDKYKRS